MYVLIKEHTLFPRGRFCFCLFHRPGFRPGIYIALPSYRSSTLLRYPSSTWDKIFYLNFFKTFLCTGSWVQAEYQGPWALVPVFKILDCWIVTSIFHFHSLGPHGSVNFKTLLLPGFQFFFNQTFFYIFPVTVFTKVAYRDVEISF